MPWHRIDRSRPLTRQRYRFMLESQGTLPLLAVSSGSLRECNDVEVVDRVVIEPEGGATNSAMSRAHYPNAQMRLGRLNAGRFHA